MNLKLGGALCLALSVSVGAQDLTTARFEALRGEPNRTFSEIRSAAERQSVTLTGSEFIIPQLLVGGEWTTTLRFTNRGTAGITAGRAVFADNTGKPVTLTLSQPSGATSSAAGITFGLPVGGMIEVPLSGDANTVFGHVLIDPATCPATLGCSLYAEATLRNRNSTRPDFESVFPSETASELQYMLFDHRNGYSSVLYLINLNTSATTAEIDFRSPTNASIRTIQVSLQSAETQILTPHALAPETIGLQGTMVIRAVNAATRGLITATGLRVNPSNSFTPIRGFVPR